MSRWMPLVVALLLALALGCLTKPPNPRKFIAGDICVIRTTGQKVIVVRVWRYYYDHARPRWRYKCRVSGVGQRRRDGVVSKDAELFAYPLVDFYGFELERTGDR